MLYAVGSQIADGRFAMPGTYWRTSPPGIDLIALFLPNLVWLARHHFPHLEMLAFVEGGADPVLADLFKMYAHASPNVRTHAKQLTDRLQTELPPLGYRALTPRDTQTPIVAFELKDTTATQKALQAVEAAFRLNDIRVMLLGFDEGSIVQEEQDSPDNDPGVVLGTSPEAGAEADREGTVTLTVSSGIPVPSLGGKELAEAESTLEELGLAAEVVEEESESIEQGTVISQSPDTGTNVGPGATVTLTVSSGSPEISIPDVVGESVKDARKALKDAGFEVEVERIFGGRVVARQSHTGTAPEGTTIKITATPGGIDLGDLDDDDDDDDRRNSNGRGNGNGRGDD